MSDIPATMPPPEVLRELRSLPKKVRKHQDFSAEAWENAKVVANTLGAHGRYSDERISIEYKPTGYARVWVREELVFLAPACHVEACRIGRWLGYLRLLRKRADAVIAEREKANARAWEEAFAPVDDRDLFPDVEEVI